jgi:hypothetical protein
MTEGLAINGHKTAPYLRGRPFAPGFDARRNCGGRPRRPAELVEALRKAEPEAVEVLVRLMRSARSESVRLAAASAILDRLYGRPTQPLSDESSEPHEIRVVWHHADPRPQVGDESGPGDAGGYQKEIDKGDHHD